MIVRAEVKDLKLHDVEVNSKSIDDGIELLKKHARKKGVVEVHGKIHINNELVMTCKLYDNGTRMSVPFKNKNNKSYAFNHEGVLKALADVVHIEHYGDSPYLEAYQELLGV